MARPEAGLWDYLRGLLPAGIHYSRIESETCPGFPDIHYTYEGTTGTIELKSVPQGKGQFPFSGKKGLRKTQRDWIDEELKAGGYVFLCLEVKPEIFLLQAGLHYDMLHKMTLADLRRVADVHWERGSDVKDQLAVALADPW
jgi:hypothetical protein